MNFPNKIKILGATWKVEYKDNPVNVDGNKRKSLWGECDYWENTIRIYDKLAPGEKWQTIIHELIHAIAGSLKLVDLNNDEDTIDLLATGLFEVLVTNGLLEVVE